MNISRIIHQNNDGITDLCKIASKYGTDKVDPHRYTPFYNYLFSIFRNRSDINLGEIGIYKNQSMKMWREYFPKANLYAWDCSQEDRLNAHKSYLENLGITEIPRTDYEDDFVKLAKMDNLYSTTYDYMNVVDYESIQNAFEKLYNNGIKFDVIIDDSDHRFYSQINIIRSSTKYLKPGGMLIIEDVSQKNYRFVEEISLYNHDKYYSEFVEVRTDANDDKIILLIKNGVEL